MRKVLLLVMALSFLAVLGAQCQAAAPAPKLQAPEVELERVEIAHYWPYLLDPKGQVPGFEGIKHGSPLTLAFILNLKNPNDFKVMLDDLKFTVQFEGYAVQTPMVYEDAYIPAQTTNQLRVEATMDAYIVLINLLVTSGFKLQDEGVSGPEKLKGWWEGIQDFAFPIQVVEGVASFKSDYGDSIVAFEGTFP
ncbi:MAG: hypothetical protein ACE5NP_10695 [Anaerolineae bacterium]